MGSVYVPPATGGSNTGSSGGNPGDQTRFIQYNYVRNYMGAHLFSWPSYRYIYLQTIIFVLAFFIIGIMHHYQVHDRSVLGVYWSKWSTKNRVIKLGRKGKHKSLQRTGSTRGPQRLHLDHRGQVVYPVDLPKDNSAPPPPTQPAIIDGVQTAFSYPPSATAAARARAQTLDRVTIMSVDDLYDDDHASMEGDRGPSFFKRVANFPRWLFSPSYRHTQRELELAKLRKRLGGRGAAALHRRKRRVIEFPSFGRLIVLFFVTAVPVVLCFMGADYINPNSAVFDFRSSWMSSNDAFLYSIGGIARRQPIEWGRGRYPSITTNPAGVTLPYRDWWTAGNRVGDFAFALTPLVVVVALKQAPWALLSTKWMGGLAFDKLSFLHQWVGRLIWIFATAHVAAWSVQLAKDQQYQQSMWNFIFWWVKFRWGIVAYIFLTLLMFLSLSPFRMDTYEWFYIAHVVCAFMFLLTSALHHPPLWPWMGSALIWWALERAHRAWKVGRLNGVWFFAPKARAARSTPPAHSTAKSSGFAFAEVLPGQTVRLTLRTPGSLRWRPGQYVNLNIPEVAWWQSHPFTIASAYHEVGPVATYGPDASSSKGSIQAEEQTLVLIIRARQGFTLSLWDHICKKRYEQIEGAIRTGSLAHVPQKHQTGVQIRAIVDGPYGSTGRIHWGAHSTVMIICGGSGVSFGLSVLEHLCSALLRHAEDSRLANGGEHYGGLPISAQARKNADADRKAFLTRRIRFVWILREFVHLQWAASALRRCIEMVSPQQLQVDIFVTHFNDESHYERAAAVQAGLVSAAQHGAMQQDARGRVGQDGPAEDASFLSPPNTPGFGPARPYGQNGGAADLSIQSRDGLGGGHNQFATNSSYAERAARFTEGPEQDEYEVQAEDLTNFDGEADGGLSKAEMEMNRRVQKEGKVRRAYTRKMSMRGRARGRGGRGPGGSTSSSGGREGAEGFLSQAELAAFSEVHGGAPVPSSEPLRPALRAMAGPVPSQRSSIPPGPGVRQPKGSAGLSSESADSSTAAAAETPIDLDEQEDEDMRVIAELARPGHPKLDKIVREECEQSLGRVMISSCGPTSLGTVLRSIATKRMDPAKVKAGDLRYQVNVVTESFDWGGS
ncbi:hypothetical protein V8E36_003282 [Tilletia maclaganii]